MMSQLYDISDMHTDIDKVLSAGVNEHEISTLYRQLKRNLKKLKNFYKKAVYAPEQNDVERIIHDNYYMLEREGKTLLKANRNVLINCMESDGVRLPFLGEIMILLASEFPKMKTEIVIEGIRYIQRSQYVTSMEIDNLIWSYRYSLINSICNSVGSGASCGRILSLISLLSLSDTIDLNEINSAVNPLECIYRDDPSGIYPQMNESTRWLYRHKTSKIAQFTSRDEISVANEMLARSEQGDDSRRRHVGTHIYKEYDAIFPQGSIGSYIFSLLFFPFAISFILSVTLKTWWLFPLLFIPTYALAKPISDYFCMKKCKNEPLPRLELNGEIPDNAKTLVVISTLLYSSKELLSLKQKLQKLYYANPSPNLAFCILCDLREANSPILPDDRPLIKRTTKLIRHLNSELGNRYIAVIRQRSYAKSSGKYEGYERKRGAIQQLISFIKGGNVHLAAFEGDMNFLANVKYICALDNDTKALMDTVPELVSIALHPLNVPVVQDGVVKSGYGIFAPRMITELGSSLKTPFSRVVGGIGGSAAYDNFGIDIYQDVFGEGIFAGKGLIDVDLFHSLLGGFFPDNRVLSHDILEGNIMRCAYVGDVQFSDGFPKNAASYYKREHRWVRGDVQNIPYICSQIETANGRIKNPMNSLARFKLLDNFRRSITPVIIFLCFFIAAFSPPIIAAAITITAILSVIMPYLFGLVPTIIRGGLFSLSQKLYSGTLTQGAQLLYQGFYALVLLPQNAIINADATIRGLFRRFISHRKILEWTTASQSEQSDNAIVSQIRYFGIAGLLGISLLFLPAIASKIAGLIFALMIPIIIYSDNEYKSPKHRITPRQQHQLISYVAAMWQFYDDFASESDNFLPPDNVQTAPVYAVAHRTSPTNIGLMLLSILAARDFELIDTDLLYDRIDKTLTTIEKLEKWEGNLYNWYDTQTLEVLPPAYVSSVDSGNFACCLVSLKEGLRDYVSENRGILSLIERIEDIISVTNLNVFYNKVKNLIAIGYDTQEDKLSASHYDLLMSESRMSSYFAVAKRQVPKKHWVSLGRTMARLGSYAGPISWTGTMFEYFMPELLLHSNEGSLSYEGLRFCLHCQKKRARDANAPFGISESGYYAFDAQLNYQYKAHGVQKLGLKRRLDDELVISPYSSFLTLSHDFNSSYNNLENLKKHGMVGTYGFYEAIDYTASRVGRNCSAIIKSFMAHHLGMSIIAISNALHDNIMQKRFMSDKSMESAAELLDERVMVGSVLFEDINKKEPPKKNSRGTPSVEVIGSFFPQQPRVNLLCNGEYTSITTDLGICHGIYQGKDTILRTTDILRRPQGAFFSVDDAWESLSVTYRTYNERESKKKAERTTEFTSSFTDYYCNTKTLRMGMKAYLHPSLPCEFRKLAIKNASGRKKNIILSAYIEPVLARFTDHFAHPAFMRLFLKQEYDNKHKIFIISRKERHSDDTTYMAIGFIDDVHFSYSMRREDVLTRPYGVFSAFDKAEDLTTSNEQVPDPCVFIKAPIHLDAYEQCEHTLFMCMAMTKEELLSRVAELRSDNACHNITTKPPLVADTIEGRLATTILPQLIYKKRDCSLNLKAIEENTLSPRELWVLGISGDLPIVLVEIDSTVEDEKITSYLKCHSSLKLCGIIFDLVFSYNDRGEYERPIHSFIASHIKEQRSEALVGINGGIHLIDFTAYDEKIKVLLQAAAVHIAPKSMMRINLPSIEYTPIELNEMRRPEIDAGKDSNKSVTGGHFTDGGFAITSPPPHPWCHVLANPAFGTLVSDSALGFTWAFNSRENKLTPWFNDLMTDNRGEMLIAKFDGKYYDLVAGSLPFFSPTRAVYEGYADDIFARTTVNVVQVGCKKNIQLEMRNDSDKEVEIELVFYTEPTLNSSREHSRQISAFIDSDMLILRNPFNSVIEGCMAIGSSEPLASYTLDRTAFWSGKWEECILSPSNEPCGAIVVKRTIASGEEVTINFMMTFAKTADAAVQIAKMPLSAMLLPEKASQNKEQNTITIDTPDKLLDSMFNTWLGWQNIGARIYARTGFFQNGGAYGYRDQLQDACAALLTNPSIAKRQIARACNAQFVEGDVLHWWHMLPRGIKKGVRTKCSDDLLWLPYTVCEYIDKTNDYSILDIEVYYIESPLLEEDEHEKYFEVTRSPIRENVYLHCKRAIEKASQFGVHGLPLMGSGDWNDGFNGVGLKGDGESVWLALFLSIVLDRFSALCEHRGESGESQRYTELANTLRENVSMHCWDGNWYLRAFYDSGDKMGSASSKRCRIDSLAQSFPIIAGIDDKDRNMLALNSAMEYLVDPQKGIIRVFYPAFDTPNMDTGYVTSYPPGTRENGGQYTHAAVWLSMAFYIAGRSGEGYELLSMLNPANHHRNAEESFAYKNEPYYMSADIYTNPESYGRGGWGIYTGAAGWYYRVILEHLLGIKIKNDSVKIDPQIPSSWQGFSASLNYRNTKIEITVMKGDSKGIQCNGDAVSEIPLNGEEHQVIVTI